MKVTDECKQAFVDVQLGHKYQYVVYKLNDKMTEIVVEKKGDVGKTAANSETTVNFIFSLSGQWLH